MRKILTGIISAVAFLGLAACSESEDATTTQSVDPTIEEQTAPETAPVEPSDDATQGMEPDVGDTGQ